MKKILWVTSQELPILNETLNTKIYNSGGWVMNMLTQLKANASYSIGIAMVSQKVKKIITGQFNGFYCYVAPEKGIKGISNIDKDFIINDFNPDLIHIEGNEFAIHNAFSKVDTQKLLSIQGILSGISPYQNGCLPMEDMMTNPFSSDFITSWVLYLKKKLRFNNRIKLEYETIKNCQYITGRTMWDQAHIHWINQDAKYFKCNRILRPQFYQNIWAFEETKPATIFVGNGYSPLKGLHIVVEAAKKLKSEFPNIKFRIAGIPPIYSGTFLSLKYFGYGSYVKRKMTKLDLWDTIEFLGSLNAERMVTEMKHSSLYLLPSLIENSPNTLGEAMLLGMPCVAAYSGGAPDMAHPDTEALFYRPNDSDVLAWQIKRLLTNQQLSISLGQRAREHALITHNVEQNVSALIDIYNAILP